MSDRTVQCVHNALQWRGGAVHGIGPRGLSVGRCLCLWSPCNLPTLSSSWVWGQLFHPIWMLLELTRCPWQDQCLKPSTKCPLFCPALSCPPLVSCHMRVDAEGCRGLLSTFCTFQNPTDPLILWCIAVLLAFHGLHDDNLNGSFSALIYCGPANPLQTPSSCPLNGQIWTMGASFHEIVQKRCKQL